MQGNGKFSKKGTPKSYSQLLNINLTQVFFEQLVGSHRGNVVLYIKKGHRRA